MSTAPANHPRKIILDKSFLQAEAKGSPRLKALAHNGDKFVITDTLTYELCSGSRPNDWQIGQRKLAPVAHRLEVWRHSAESLKMEVEQQNPVVSHLDTDLTDRFRALLLSGQEQLASDVAPLTAAEKTRREQDSPDAAFAFCTAFADLAPDYFKKLRTLSSNQADVSHIVQDAISNERLVAKVVVWSHGNSSCPDTYIAAPGPGLTSDWFAYQNAKTLIAVAFVYCLRYSGQTSPSRDFRHTILDADYLSLLFYADAMATNETSGGMAAMATWLHGNTKTVFSTGDVDACLVTESEIRDAAYELWAEAGRTHGHDWDDWFAAEQASLGDLWRRLQQQVGTT